MKNIFILTLIIINVVIFSCKGPTPEPDSEPIKDPDGALAIKFTDSRLEGVSPDIMLSNDDIFAISVNIKKAPDGSKPVKMAIYVTETFSIRGILLLDNIKLKEIDEQTKSIELSLPSAGTTIYRIVYMDITDNKGKISRKAVNIIPTASAQIISWANVNLGLQTSNLQSRFSSLTGDVYTTCDLDSNLNFVDITYATINSTSVKPTILSNPRRGALGLGVTASDKICTNVSVAGGTPTFYAPINVPIEFGTVNNLFLKNLLIPSTTQDLVIEAGKIYMFQHTRVTKDGKTVIRKGVIKINTISNYFPTTGGNIVSGLVNFDVKVQR
ncbi:MAG: hypothetical protein H7339_09090 [Arcicella sp.]|nr:hypothetical protein [Arcicella sp.]